jgi:short-subunit dehydrogenase
MKNPRHILITGASSGLGEALALAYAQPGIVLGLTGRDTARLNDVAARCRASGAEVDAAPIDVTDAPTLRQWMLTLDARAPLDLVIANAGISAQNSGRGETDEQARRIMAVNVDGVMNTVRPLIEPMVGRGRGQIAIMSSLAAFRGLPGTGVYCASKAAVRLWGEALRVELAPRGVEVSVICPGFVTSRMTATNEFPMPFLMGPERAVRIIRGGLERNKGRIAFPWPMYAAARLIAALPSSLADRVSALRP